MRIQMNKKERINIPEIKNKGWRGTGTNSNNISPQERSKTPYSERKINAKNAPEYSVLNPETNSDSASEKSKGARWVSARVQTTHKGSRMRSLNDLE